MPAQHSDTDTEKETRSEKKSGTNMWPGAYIVQVRGYTIPNRGLRKSLAVSPPGKAQLH